ncbi:MAG: 2Fe-2S iron-sulfur cluster binding domain-containing protein [Sphingobacteriales bacterium]|nr:2Fe-2S iron-sulfur cluster binding domain-containing protein [Sphingobacteriales bacterium]MCC7223688.1 2Fe-2S iron-sulfur cluster binding domain-containing protein [Chitinophagales bacterium]
MPTIHINFEQSDLQPTSINAEEGYTILEAVLLNDIHLNHNCGGVCACTTCHIYVEQGDDLIEEISEKEEDYIDRAINPRLESRLACQCLLLEDEGEISIVIPDQSGIIGHEH